MEQFNELETGRGKLRGMLHLLDNLETWSYCAKRRGR